MKITPPTIFGKLVYLKEIEPSDFDDVIRWRNDPENNRYLNQPYQLTREMQEKWYAEKYLTTSDVLFIFFDNKTNKRFGMIGYNDYLPLEKICIAGRLLVGEKNFRGSVQVLEANLLFYHYLFDTLQLKTVYCHIVHQNKKAISLDTKLGFYPSEVVRFPEYLKVNNLEQFEMMMTQESFEKCYTKLMPIVEHYANN